MNPSPMVLSPRKWIYGVQVEVDGASGGPQGRGVPPGGGRALHPREQGVGPLVLILSPVFFINSKNILHWFSCHSKNFYFCTKITSWLFCWKQRQFGLVPFKSCKLESKTRAKVFVKSRYDGDVSTPPSLNLCLSSSNSVDKLKVIKRNFYKLYFLLLL